MEKTVKVGDTVLVKQTKTTKKPPFNPDPFTVVEIKGTQAMLDTWKETEKEFQQYPGGQK